MIKPYYSEWDVKVQESQSCNCKSIIWDMQLLRSRAVVIRDRKLLKSRAVNWDRKLLKSRVVVC
jgi:hypothetical protein